MSQLLVTRVILLSLGVWLYAPHARADVSLVVWRSGPGAPPTILPKLSGESPVGTVQRYLKNFYSNPDLNRLAQKDNVLMDAEQVEPISKYVMTTRPRVALIANQIDDMLATGERIHRDVQLFSASGADPFVIAVAADVGLTDAQARQFRDQVAREFDLMVSLGGSDLSPDLYGEASLFARNNNETRDRSEFELIKRFKDVSAQRGYGVFFGICRGHQLGAVVDGHSIFQDLTASGSSARTESHIHSDGSDLAHKQVWHQIIVRDSLLKRFLRDYLIKQGWRPESKSNVTVYTNSLHHEAVRLIPQGRSVPVAMSEDGIIEVLETPDGLSISVQFHPEFPAAVSGNEAYSKMGEDLIRHIISYARLRRQRAHAQLTECSRIFAAPDLRMPGFNSGPVGAPSLALSVLASP